MEQQDGQPTTVKNRTNTNSTYRCKAQSPTGDHLKLSVPNLLQGSQSSQRAEPARVIKAEVNR